ncbi:MAG TPA: hypothetical protein VMH84_15365 [Xanthobacteraceae bacterium]|nr:hypothetical protein [Xanthobacteraceae bacterium]
MPAERPLRSPPVGAVVLALLAALLYVVHLAGLHDAKQSDAAGNALTDAFIAIFGIALWIVLGGLMLVAFKNGKMPTWAAIGALVLVPLAAYASFVSSDLYANQRGWAFIVPALLPPVIVIYALWIRFPALVAALSETIASAVAGGAVVALVAASALASYLDALAAPARQAALQAAYEKMRAEQDQAYAEQRARDEAKFAALSPDSSLRDYLEYMNGTDARARKALADARNVKSRQADAVALLQEEKRLTPLSELWQLNLEVTPALCDAYRAALRRAAAKIDPSYSNRLGEAIDLEFQLPNLKWLVSQHCDLHDILTDLARRLRIVRDSSRIDKLADTMEALGTQN